MKIDAMNQAHSRRKRADYRRKVMAALHQILNDPGRMPNVDFPDLVVNIREVEFGTTVRTIYIDIIGRPRNYETFRDSHDRYTQASNAAGLEGAYDDLTDVACNPRLMEMVAKALQQQLGLMYLPTIHVVPGLKRSDAAGLPLPD